MTGAGYPNHRSVYNVEPGPANTGPRTPTSRYHRSRIWPRSPQHFFFFFLRCLFNSQGTSYVTIKYSHIMTSSRTHELFASTIIIRSENLSQIDSFGFPTTQLTRQIIVKQKIKKKRKKKKKEDERVNTIVVETKDIIFFYFYFFFFSIFFFIFEMLVLFNSHRVRVM